MTQPAVQLLCDLIGYDTRSPGGDELAICSLLADKLRDLGADRVHLETVDRPEGPCAYVAATFGRPHLLINAHIDTVPANAGWSTDPWVASVRDGRVIGLGAADNKGAVASILTTIVRQRPRDTTILFSGDEELSGLCMRAFLSGPHCKGLHHAIVCEPTGRRIGVAHRGMRAYRARFSGRGGHSSLADSLPKPMVRLAQLAVAVDELGSQLADVGTPQLSGFCVNIAAVNGGVAFNVVPKEAELLFSIRPPPGLPNDVFDTPLERLRRAVDPEIAIDATVEHPAFNCLDLPALEQLLGPSCGPTTSLDFWTEAALLAERGIDAVVVGPGEIEQAHAADEFVSIADLEWATELFCHVFKGTDARE